MLLIRSLHSEMANERSIFFRSKNMKKATEHWSSSTPVGYCRRERGTRIESLVFQDFNP